MQQQVPPLALLISSLAYFYNSVNDVVPPVFRGPLRSGLILDRSTILSETTYGSLKGLKEVSRNGRRYFSFRGKYGVKMHFVHNPNNVSVYFILHNFCTGIPYAGTRLT